MGVGETIFVTVAAAFIVALAALAKRQPTQYRKLANVLASVALAAFIGTAIYGVALDRAATVLLEFVERAYRPGALNALKAITPDFDVALWIFGGAVSYLYALTYLPRVLGSRDDNPQNDDSKKEE